MSVLIEATELARALAEAAPCRVLDVRWYLAGRDGRADFEHGHVPGAQWVDLDTELAGAAGSGGRHPLPPPVVFQAAMRRVGLQADGPVVVMDDGSLMGAARLWWMLRDCGIAARVLNGGLNAWKVAGLPLETGPSEPAPVSSIALTPGHLPTVDSDQVRALSISATSQLWDVRAPERFAGLQEPVDPVAGHIPGARNLPASGAFADGRLRPTDELRSYFRDVHPGDVVYCGSGVTATQTLLALAVAGVAGVRLYPGSWSAWITDPDRAVAVTDTPSVPR